MNFNIQVAFQLHQCPFSISLYTSEMDNWLPQSLQTIRIQRVINFQFSTSSDSAELEYLSIQAGYGLLINILLMLSTDNLEGWNKFNFLFSPPLLTIIFKITWWKSPQTYPSTYIHYIFKYRTHLFTGSKDSKFKLKEFLKIIFTVKWAALKHTELYNSKGFQEKLNIQLSEVTL